jgi:hypothetical protein
MDGITDKERTLYAQLFGIDRERVLEQRRWVFDRPGEGLGTEADILVQGVTDAERKRLTSYLPSGWRVVGRSQWL